MRLVQAGWALGGGVGDQNIRIKGQAASAVCCQLSGSGLVSADNTNNPSDVQVDWIPDGWYRPSNWCKQQMANCLKHFLLCTGTPLLEYAVVVV